MPNTSLLYCPHCNKRALRLGKCLQCGFRGEGASHLTPKQRLQASKPPESEPDRDWSAWCDLSPDIGDSDAGGSDL